MDAEKLLAQIESTPISASTRTVFGEPIKVGERTLIPVARIGGGFGLGFGGGKSKPKEESGEASSGQGGGGGGKVSARPIAVIDATAEKVRVIPIVDVTRLIRAGMLLAAWNVFWITLTIRKVHAQHEKD